MKCTMFGNYFVLILKNIINQSLLQRNTPHDSLLKQKGRLTVPYLDIIFLLDDIGLENDFSSFHFKYKSYFKYKPN